MMVAMKKEHPIKVWREKNGVTQAELARMAKLTTGRISQIESGYAPPGREAIQRLSAATGGEVTIVALHMWSPDSANA
jgi:transcriptional regulator with XRE-family HTH domain